MFVVDCITFAPWLEIELLCHLNGGGGGIGLNGFIFKKVVKIKIQERENDPGGGI